MDVYMLLDRSASMSSRWEETLGSINTYVEDLTKEKKGTKAKITLALFDLQGVPTFDVIRESVKASEWKPVETTEAYPRGWTPLNDSIGKIVSLAEKNNPKKAVMVIMTDGEENSSREMSRDQAKAALERCRQKKWQVVFLGVDFDADQQASGYGTSFNQTVNMAPGHYAATMRGLAGQTMAYATCDSAMNFTSDFKMMAGDDKVKQKSAFTGKVKAGS